MASSKSIVLPAVVLALRLLAVALLAGSLSLVVTETDINSDFTVWRIPIHLRFMDVYTYRYILAIAVIGCAYSLMMVPLAAVTIAIKKRVVGGKTNVALFLICVDAIFALAFATAAGAGFGFSYDVKRFVDQGFNNVPKHADRSIRLTANDIKLMAQLHNDLDKFFLRAYAAAGLMLLAAKCTAAVIVVSAIYLVK